MRGADSFNSGSGALVVLFNYRTLGADDDHSPKSKMGILLKKWLCQQNSDGRIL